MASSEVVEPRRAATALTDAVTTRLADVERPAIRVGVALVAGVVVILGLLAQVVPELAVLGRLPWWLPPVLIAGSGAIVVAAMPLLLLPRHVLDAFAAVTYVSVSGIAGWRWAVQDDYPQDSPAMERWLGAHADRPDLLLERAGLLLNLDRPAEAIALLDGYAARDHEAAFLHAQLLWSAAFMLGRDDAALLERCRSLASGYVAGTPRRRIAEAYVEHLVAARAIGLDEDWTEPLVRARRFLGGLARGIAFRHLFLPRLRQYGTLSAFIAVALLGVQGLFVLGLSSPT